MKKEKWHFCTLHCLSLDCYVIKCEFTRKITKIQNKEKSSKGDGFALLYRYLLLRFHEKNYENSKQRKIVKRWWFCDISQEKFKTNKSSRERFCSAQLRFHEKNCEKTLQFSREIKVVNNKIELFWVKLVKMLWFWTF